MPNRISLKKGLSIGIIGISLLLSSVSIGLAGEGDSSGGHGGMNMGGSAATHVEPKSNETPQEMTNLHPEPDHSSSEPGHEATPDMDPNQPGHDAVNGEAEQSSSGSHGETSGGHGEGASDPEGVNRPVVWGFAGINALVVGIAGILKFMNNNKPSTVEE